ncbi:MAG: hypothetical protein U5N85_09995 [Arcicella sp.]|nr:hypothetical protein [Arcicella sp.]
MATVRFPPYLNFILYQKSRATPPQGDVIYKSDGSQIIVKIIEIDETKIKYKNVITGDNYIYSVNVKDVEKIVYSNGFCGKYEMNN